MFEILYSNILKDRDYFVQQVIKVYIGAGLDQWQDVAVHSDELSGCVKGKGFLDQLSAYGVLELRTAIFILHLDAAQHEGGMFENLQ